MTREASITVRIVHIDGPYKGSIDEFDQFPITIGRQSACHISFPQDQTLISRRHAEITREGNRFKIVDRSTNGTFINGKKTTEAFLKDGDVLLIGQGGPKISFLSEMKTFRQDTAAASASSGFEDAAGEAVPSAPTASEADAFGGAGDSEMPPAPIQPAPPPLEREPVQQVQAPLIIQHGPTIQSYRQLPVEIGKGPNCDFVLNHEDIIDRHLQISFRNGNYWIADLTGQHLVLVNGVPVTQNTPLQTGCELALSPRGPFFKLLEGGRLVEMETPPADGQGNPASPEPAPSVGGYPPLSPPLRSRKRVLLFSGTVVLLILLIVAVVLWVPGDGGEAWMRLKESVSRLVTPLVDWFRGLMRKPS